MGISPSSLLSVIVNTPPGCRVSCSIPYTPAVGKAIPQKYGQPLPGLAARSILERWLSLFKPYMCRERDVADRKWRGENILLVDGFNLALT